MFKNKTIGACTDIIRINLECSIEISTQDWNCKISLWLLLGIECCIIQKYLKKNTDEKKKPKFFNLVKTCFPLYKRPPQPKVQPNQSTPLSQETLNGFKLWLFWLKGKLQHLYYICSHGQFYYIRGCRPALTPALIKPKRRLAF